MTSDDREVVRLLRTAAESLGLQITSPFSIKDVDGTEYVYLVMINGFGASTGLLIACDTIVSGNSREEDYALSLLRPDSIDTLEKIREMLLHWGWFGPDAEKPKWVHTN